jgi:hypothetical protein
MMLPAEVGEFLRNARVPWGGSLVVMASVKLLALLLCAGSFDDLAGPWSFFLGFVRAGPASGTPFDFEVSSNPNCLTCLDWSVQKLSPHVVPPILLRWRMDWSRLF